MFRYKTPIVRKNISNTPQLDLNNTTQYSNLLKTKNQGNDENLDITPIGFLVLISYILVFSFSYGNSFLSKKIGFNHVNGFTLSYAFKNENKTFGIFTCVLFISLYIGLMIHKGFVIPDKSDSANLKIVAVALSFCLLLGFLLLFILTPKKGNGTENNIHYFLAGCILLFIILSSCIIYFVYNGEYEENIFLEIMKYTLYMIGVTGFIILSVVILYITKSLKFGKILAFSEIILVLLFFIILCIFSIMPKLINYEKICIGVLKN
jgi:hypothetical protein